MAYDNVEGAQDAMNNAMSNTTGMDAFKSALKRAEILLASFEIEIESS